MSLVTSTLLGTEKKNLNSQTVLHTRTHSSQNATRVLKQLHLSRVLKSAKKEVTLSLTRFLLFPIFKKFLFFFFSVKTAHSYLMPRVLSKLRDQHSSNYTMSWHTAHAALEPNGSILPLAEISTGEEGREGSQPDTQCKSHWCQGFPSQTLQLQWAILQLWPLWSSGPSAEWRRKSSPVIQFPQGATGEVKGQGGHSVGPRHNWPPQPWFTTTVVSNTEEKELGVLA